MPATATMTRLIPLGDRLVVVAVEPEAATASGLVIPDTAQESPTRGTVLAVGPGKRSEATGERLAIGINPGDTVVYANYAGTESTIDGQALLIVSAGDVLTFMGDAPES